MTTMSTETIEAAKSKAAAAGLTPTESNIKKVEKQLGSVLRYFRERRGWSQTEVAGVLERSSQNISHHELNGVPIKALAEYMTLYDITFYDLAYQLGQAPGSVKKRSTGNGSGNGAGELSAADFVPSINFGDDVSISQTATEIVITIKK